MLRSNPQRWIPELRFAYPPLRNFPKSFWRKLGIFLESLGGSQRQLCIKSRSSIWTTTPTNVSNCCRQMSLLCDFLWQAESMNAARCRRRSNSFSWAGGFTRAIEVRGDTKDEQQYRRPHKHCIHKKFLSELFLARLQLQLHKQFSRGIISACASWELIWPPGYNYNYMNYSLANY